MSLTVNHNKGKFTIDFTPDDDASIQIISASLIKVNVDITGLGDEESNRDNKDTAAEMTSSAPEQLSAEAPAEKPTEAPEELSAEAPEEKPTEAPEDKPTEAEQFRSENMESSEKASGVNGPGTYVEDPKRTKDHTKKRW